MQLKELAKILFKIRSYTPVPFVILMLVFYNGNLYSWIIGALVLIAGELIRLWGVTYAGSLTRTTTTVKANQLVTSGPFAHVRNPLYIGNILMYLGFGIISMSLFPYLQLFALIWFVFQYILIISIEEEFLASKFGSQYAEYQKQVPRIFPKIIGMKTDDSQIIRPDFKKGIKSEMRTIQAIISVSILALIIHFLK